MSFGDRLRELRTAAGLSQAKLAKQMGVSRNAVSQWEAGISQPSTKRLLALARELGVAVDAIIAPTAKTRERIVIAAARLFDRVGFDETTVDVICASADVTRAEFDNLFAGREELLYTIGKSLSEQMFSEIERQRPTSGSIASRLKQLLRLYYTHDSRHKQLTAALHAYSWHWGVVIERENAKQLARHHDLFVKMLNEAQGQGQLRCGDYRAASELILAAYVGALRHGLHDNLDPDRLLAYLEPQIAIIVGGLAAPPIPGAVHDPPSPRSNR